jgi:hypothetical protein
MTVLTFPSNPVEGDTYPAPNGVLYTFDGVKWVVTTTTVTSSAVTNFVQDSTASMIANGVHNGLIVGYNNNTNELTLSLDIDGGEASTNF